MALRAFPLAKTTRPAFPLESFSSSGTRTLRHVGLRQGSIVTTSMGHAESRTNEDAREHAERALLQMSERPTAGNGRVVRCIDVYSGLGAISLGVAEGCRAVGRAFEAVAAFDSWQPALDTYARNFPEAQLIGGDVARVVDGAYGDRPTATERSLHRKLGKIDLVVAGPPCQGWSNLNNHTRGRDPKNRLYARVARLAELLSPDTVLIENVVGVGRDSRQGAVKTLDQLDKLGYQVAAQVVSLLDIGVAQRRRRHVVVATRSRGVDPGAILDPFLCRPRTVRWAIGDLIVRPGSEFDSASAPSVRNTARMAWLRSHRAYDLPDRLRPRCHRETDHSYVSMYGRLRWDQPAQTITSGFGSMGQGRFVHPNGRRTLTPHEAARLQYIPDWVDLGAGPRTNWATLIGNAVPLKLSYAITLSLFR